MSLTFPIVFLCVCYFMIPQPVSQGGREEYKDNHLYFAKEETEAQRG
jgi:hypothetical protein